MSLYEKYRAEINRWDWNNIVSAAMGNPVEGDGDGEPYGSAYIGSILSLSPSGKCYQPFASSNVDPCPICHGRGTVTNRHGNAQAYEQMKSAQHARRMEAVDRYGSWSNGGWPETVASDLDRSEKDLLKLKPEITCPRCNGLGSYEAYQDEEFWQALEHVADKHGGSIEQGEGDPLDTFFCIAIEPEDEEDSDGDESEEALGNE